MRIPIPPAEGDKTSGLSQMPIFVNYRAPQLALIDCDETIDAIAIDTEGLTSVFKEASTDHGTAPLAHTTEPSKNTSKVVERIDGDHVTSAGTVDTAKPIGDTVFHNILAEPTMSTIEPAHLDMAIDASISESQVTQALVHPLATHETPAPPPSTDFSSPMLVDDILLPTSDIKTITTSHPDAVSTLCETGRPSKSPIPALDDTPSPMLIDATPEPTSMSRTASELEVASILCELNTPSDAPIPASSTPSSLIPTSAGTSSPTLVDASLASTPDSKAITTSASKAITLSQSDAAFTLCESIPTSDSPIPAPADSPPPTRADAAIPPPSDPKTTTVSQPEAAPTGCGLSRPAPPSTPAIAPRPSYQVTRTWPRPPTAGAIQYKNIAGLSPSGVRLWGASTRDFYHVQLNPAGDTHAKTILSGSVLATWTNEHAKAGERKSWLVFEPLIRAREEAREGLRKLGAEFFRGLLEKQEEEIRKGMKGDGKLVQGGSSPESVEDAGVPQYTPPIPFSHDIERIQQQIPLSDLPEKLIVHDPWNLLAVCKRNRFGLPRGVMSDVDWGKDVTHVYRLSLSGRARAYREQQAAAASEASKASSDDNTSRAKDGVNVASDTTGLILLPSSDASKPTAQPIFVVSDPRPSSPPPTKLEEAHLYISPAHKCGSGSHSVVWKAEWEIQRSYLIPPPPPEYVMCRTCVLEDVERIRREEGGNDEGMVDEAWTMAEAIMKRKEAVEGITDDSCGEVVEVGEPGEILTIAGPIRTTQTTVLWQDTACPTCPHIPPSAPATPEVPTPLTVKVRVAAKLSRPDDEHMRREARNYQCFPQHFFEHWSGYTLLDKMETVVPVCPVVPQFYGYYVAEAEETLEGADVDATDKRKPRGYLSPIMLLEDCGQGIVPRTLARDERTEVASLFHRFHMAGWVHNSPFERNIVVQPGPLNITPSARNPMAATEARELSFRLVDFGRSYCDGVPTSGSSTKYQDVESEDKEVEGMFAYYY